MGASASTSRRTECGWSSTPTWSSPHSSPTRKTRELVVTLEPNLLTPAFVHDEIENYEGLIVEKSGMEPRRIRQFVDLLFQYIEIVPTEEFYPYIEEAEAAIGETDPDDVLYVACALATDADIWSDDSDFDEQDAVETHSTSDVIDSFDTR